jgi:regulator of sigma E protease
VIHLLQTIGAAVVVLGVLIFVHELGHFLAAKSVGIAVLRFSFGFGPVTPLSITVGETEYCVSWVPLGGYVKMAGLEDEGSAGGIEGPKAVADIAPERTFDAKPLWARIFVISAGVMMNALFAVIVYAGLTAVYGVQEDPTVTVGGVLADSLPVGAGPLAEIKPGDRILRINGDTMRGWRDIQGAFLTSNETPLRIDIAGRVEPVLVDVPMSEQQQRLTALQTLIPWHEPVIGEVLPGSPASAAGLAKGDRLLRVDGDTIPAWERFVRTVEQSAGETLSVTVLRAGQEVTMPLAPRATTVPVADGGSKTVGRVGVGPDLPLKRYGVVGSIGQGFRRAGAAGGLVLFTLKGLLMGQLSPRDLGGPILVAQLSGEAARLGADVLFGFMALFSMNLAVLNMLPIPVLDGGHLMFLIIEGVRRRPLSVVQRQRFTQVGFFLLIALMVLALANDVSRVVAGWF